MSHATTRSNGPRAHERLDSSHPGHYGPLFDRHAKVCIRVARRPQPEAQPASVATACLTSPREAESRSGAELQDHSPQAAAAGVEARGAGIAATPAGQTTEPTGSTSPSDTRHGFLVAALNHLFQAAQRCCESF